MKVIIGSDHAGYPTKEIVKQMLKRKYLVKDVGTFNAEDKVDYPDYAFKVAKQIIKGKAKGVLVCGTGIGMTIAANKVKGARAAFVYDEYGAVMSREHNDANIIVLRGRKFSAKKAGQLALLWLKTPFSNEERHKKRIAKLNKA